MIKKKYYSFFLLPFFRLPFFTLLPFHSILHPMASYTHHHPDDTIVMSSRKQHQQQQRPPQLHDSYLQSLEAMPSLPPLSHLLTSEQAAAAAVAAAATPDHNSSAVQSPLSASSSSVNTTPRTLAYIPQAASTTASAMYYTQPPVIPPTVPSATMMMPTQGSDVYPLDAHFLPLDSTTSMANINPYPSIAPRRERNSSVSSTASSDTNKVYSFVAIPGTNQKKRPRRRYDEIERLYHCNWQGCSKAYGTLNHLNAHVSMQKHVSCAHRPKSHTKRVLNSY